MKLSLNVFGFELGSIKFEEMHKQADFVESVVTVAERKGAKLAGKAVDKFSTLWMKAWVSK